MQSNQEKVLKLIRTAGVLRPRELKPHRIPRTVLTRLMEEGKIRKLGRGLYALSDAMATEHLDLMEVCKRVPHGVVCLISALSFHGMTTQMPHGVWLALANKAHHPRVKRPPIRVIRFSERSLNYGVKTHVLHGVKVSITTPAKTVADCFKYRSKVGIDVAVESLKAFRQMRKQKLDDLWQSAEVCRVAQIIRPYLEAIA